MNTLDRSLKLKMFAKNNQIGMALIISLLLFVFNVVINPDSLNPSAFGNIFTLTAMLAIASAGQTLVIISDGIDMSVGSVMSMTALLSTAIMKTTEDPILVVEALVVALIVGAVIGFCNGFGSVKIGLPPLVVTLCISNVVTRLQYVFTQGKPTGRAAQWFTTSVTYRVFGVFPTTLLYFGAILFIVLYILNRTHYGKQLFLTGNNNRAAYLSGVKTVKMKMLNYTLAGVFAGFAGFVGAGYMNFVMCSAFDSYTMMSIVAVVIGGTLLVGGKGSFVGTAAGALLMIVLSNCLVVLDLPQALRDVIMGIVLIILLAVYNRSKAVRQ